MDKMNRMIQKEFSKMKCAMVILNYRDSERAVKLAKRVEAFAAVDHIVIVDNNSQDGSYERMLSCKSDKIEIIKSDKNGGFAAGNNIGAKYIVTQYHPEYLFFANTDTIFEEENILKCMNVLSTNSSLGLVSTRMYGPDEKEQKASYEYPTYRSLLKGLFWIQRKKWYNQMQKNLSTENEFPEIMEVDYIRGSFMFFRAAALEKAGYFDDHTFLYFEEPIVCTRLNRKGYKVGLITDTYYIHDHMEADTNKNAKSIKRYNESMYYFCKEYLDISLWERFIMRVSMVYSAIEIESVELIKKIVGKNK